MPLLYALVSRHVDVLAEYTPDGVTGNFPTIARVLLKKLETAAASTNPAADSVRRSFEHDQYAFHTLQQLQPAPLTFLVLADKAFPRTAALACLDAVQRRFDAQYGARAATAIAYAYQADFSRTLRAQLERANAAAASADTMAQIRNGIADVKEQMADSIDAVILRGERIELLVDKSEELEAQAIRFERGGRALKCDALRQNAKWGAILCVVLAIIVTGFVMGFCGADFHKCRKS